MILPPPGWKPPVLQTIVPSQRTVVGVDLGFSRDHTAIAVLEEREFEAGFDAANWCKLWEKRTTVHHLERLPLRTSYLDAVERVREVVESMSVAPDRTRLWEALPAPRAVVVDGTGVGMPVVQLLKQALQTMVVPVFITGGDTASRDGGAWRVPKREIVSNLQILLEQRKLKFPAGMAEAPALIKEMQGMRVKVTALGNEQFGCWREGEHDDLILAVGLGAWWLGN